MSKRSAVLTQWTGAGCAVASATTAAATVWNLALGVASGLAVAAAALLFFGWAGEVEASPEDAD